MIVGNKYINDKDSEQLDMFITAINKDGRWKRGPHMLTHPEDQIKQSWGDLSGKALDPLKVKTAREEEMKEFRSHEVYKKVPIKECWAITGKDPIGTRWVDINKGDELQPEYRSRLVAQELNQDNKDTYVPPHLH